MFAPGSSRAPGILTDGAYFLDREPDVFKVIFDNFNTILNYVFIFLPYCTRIGMHTANSMNGLKCFKKNLSKVH